MDGFHHLRQRARVTQGLEPFPARDTWKRLLDRVMYLVGIFAPLALFPQIIQIYSTQSAAGLSLLTWTLLALFNVLWAAYGAVHKDRQLVVATVLMALCHTIVIAGIVLY